MFLASNFTEKRPEICLLAKAEKGKFIIIKNSTNNGKIIFK